MPSVHTTESKKAWINIVPAKSISPPNIYVSRLSIPRLSRSQEQEFPNQGMWDSELNLSHTPSDHTKISKIRKVNS